mgnify:CR=1 FL=1
MLIINQKYFKSSDNITSLLNNFPVYPSLVSQMSVINKLDLMYVSKVYKNIGYRNLKARMSLYDMVEKNKGEEVEG